MRLQTALRVYNPDASSDEHGAIHLQAQVWPTGLRCRLNQRRVCATDISAHPESSRCTHTPITCDHCRTISRGGMALQSCAHKCCSRDAD